MRENLTYGSTRGWWKPSSAGRHRSTLRIGVMEFGVYVFSFTPQTKAKGLSVLTLGLEFHVFDDEYYWNSKLRQK